MSKRIVWILVSVLMVFSLAVAACGPAAAPATPTVPAAPAAPTAPTVPAAPAAPTTPAQEKPQQEAVKPAEEMPKYGGTLNVAMTGPIDSWVDGLSWSVSWNMLYDHLWDGDWSRGAAAGFGTKETDWSINHDRFDLYTGAVAESWRWTIDAQTDMATTVLDIRPGIHYYQIPGHAASKKVGGRELTPEDVVWTMEVGDFPTRLHSMFPSMQPTVAKTGPWEVTIGGIDSANIRRAAAEILGRVVRPPELVTKFQDFADWRLQVATGPFMMTDYVPDSVATFKRNANWWNKDPIGPGKGNQLPYIDVVRFHIIPDISTRQAALRTGKVDVMQDFSPDDAKTMKRTAPELVEHKYYAWGARNASVQMRVDMPPFNDVRVRRAVMMATDFEAIRQGLFEGDGIINTFPFTRSPLYAPLHIPYDSPELTEETRDLYSYNPEKAKQLLADAGYPNGFKVDLLLTPAQVDYIAILKDMWSKVGINAEFMVRESAAKNRLVMDGGHPPMASGWSASLSSFSRPTELSQLGNVRSINQIKEGDDPVLDAYWAELGELANQDHVGAMKRMREILKEYILPQAYGVPAPDGPSTVFWWPWLKGYSGEVITLSGKYYRWAAWAWIDQELKKGMGY